MRFRLGRDRFGWHAVFFVAHPQEPVCAFTSLEIAENACCRMNDAASVPIKRFGDQAEGDDFDVRR